MRRAALLALALAACGPPPGGDPADAGPPNVVLIVADDLGFGDVGFHDGYADTPHLDALTETIVVDHTTTAPAPTAERARKLAAEGVAYLHAPVFMSPAACLKASGMMLAAGPRELFDRVFGTIALAGDGKDATLPTLDVDDFMGKSFTTGPDGKLYQLPDQQFANLYWFRYDWFQRPELKKQFKERYGYELGVPVNWSAYEDIADFFTNDVRELDGVRVWGHMDYGKKDPSLGWRFTDAWLSMAGVGEAYVLSRVIRCGLATSNRCRSCNTLPVSLSMQMPNSFFPSSVAVVSQICLP